MDTVWIVIFTVIGLVYAGLTLYDVWRPRYPSDRGGPYFDSEDEIS